MLEQNARKQRTAATVRQQNQYDDQWLQMPLPRSYVSSQLALLFSAFNELNSYISVENLCRAIRDLNSALAGIQNDPQKKFFAVLQFSETLVHYNL